MSAFNSVDSTALPFALLLITRCCCCGMGLNEHGVGVCNLVALGVAASLQRVYFGLVVALIKIGTLLFMSFDISLDSKRENSN